MGGIGSTLQIAKGGLAAQQYGLNVTGNNIANVNNPDYSRQSVEQINNNPIKYAGFLFGTGVNSSQVTQSVNQLLENRLTGEKASLSGFQEAESYIKIISDHFNESSDNSISNVLTDFWNSWNDLSNNPGDDSERLIILENGQELSERFNRAYDYLGQVDTEINMKLVNAADRINNITDDIARLNQDIMGQEQARTSNDKRDQRNSLVDELGKLININVFEQTNGAVAINVINGLPIVNGNSTYDIAVSENSINWVDSAGRTQDITDKITGGQIGGWLDVRDSVVPKYQADINELSHEIIWAINYQHSQGVGLEYFSNGLTGEYAVDQGGWLSSLPFGDKIDHSKNLGMWIEDNTTADPQYSKIEMDIGVSQAKISNWQAGADLTAVTTAPAAYKFTVMDGTTVGDGSSIITLGGKDGYEGFTAGKTISLAIDGVGITYTVAGATDEDFASQLQVVLNGVLSLPDYTVTKSETAISIFKASNPGNPIAITNFNSPGGGKVTLKTDRPTGGGTSAPDNDILISSDYLTANGLNPLQSSSTSSLYPDKGIIMWEEYNTEGFATGNKGLIIDIEDAENVSLKDSSGNELLTFDISAGSLVAGNTMSINVNYNSLTGDAGPNPLDFTIKGTANKLNEIYQFKVLTGGTIGTPLSTGESPITIQWGDKTFEIKEPNPPLTPDVPYNVEVDGMTLKFTNGTLFKGDVFTITTNDSGKPVSTNENGKPTGELLSDWHWTLDSFKNQFNKDGQGMKATVNDSKLELLTSDDYHALTKIRYSETNGFTKDNISIDVKDWSALAFEADDIKFIRSATGAWSIFPDPTGGNVKFYPAGGSDDGFGVDFNGDQLADIEITFKNTVTGDGVNEDFFAFDLVKREPADIGFAFSDESGTMAALGFNTFFKGEDALTIGLNDVLKDTNFIAAATINPETGIIAKGDNSNTLSLADVQFKSLDMKQWTFKRGSEPESSMTTATLDGYYSTMLGSLGVDAKNIQSAKDFSTLMVNYITEQRDSISAVSLDEEMVKLMEYQHAFAAASKLVKTADEMMNTIIGLR